MLDLWGNLWAKSAGTSNGRTATVLVPQKAELRQCWYFKRPNCDSAGTSKGRTATVLIIIMIIIMIITMIISMIIIVIIIMIINNRNNTRAAL